MVLDGLSHVSELTHPHLVIQHNTTPAKVRQLHILVGIAGELRTLKINNADLNTLAAALLERMYFCKVGNSFEAPPSVSDEIVHSKLSKFRSKLLRKFGDLPSKLTPEEFVDMFRGRKHTIYNNALEEYYEVGVMAYHAVSAAFVKCEKVNPTKAPRCIQPRHPVYNIGVGSYLKHIEHRLYRAVGKVFNDKHVIIKGFNVRQIADIMVEKWDSFRDPVGVGMDATKFDMHVSPSMLRWEHSIYHSLYRGDRELKRLLQMQIANKGVGYCDDGKLRYKVQGRRFSGDMNTALGNCLIMCAMIYAYAEERSINIKLMNNGDDCVIFMERENVDAFHVGLEEWFLQLGFRMTREAPASKLEQIEFCQMRCIRTSTGPIMVRNWTTAREKDSMCLFPLDNAAAMQKWLWAVGECGLALTGGIPVMQEMYKCYMRNGVISKMNEAVHMQCGAMFLRKGMDSKELPVSDEARVSFMEAWDITPDEQYALEEYYMQLNISYGVDQVENLDQIFSSPL